MKESFYHHLRDIIILLGGGTRIANMAANPNGLSDADVDELRRLNCRLIDAAKERLVSINKIELEPGDDE